MHQRIGKKILIYFFLLCMVGSINNNEFNNLKFKKIRNINILGLGQKNNQDLLTNIKDLNLENIFFINKNEISNLISSNTLVQDYIIFKRYPLSLDIHINKTKFLAKINNDGKIFIVGSNGKLSLNNINKSNNLLPFIFGKPHINEFLEFKNIIDNSKFNYNDIKNLYFFPSKRWDLELKNNILIRLPLYDIKKTLDLASEFLINKNLKDIKVVDARIQNQIILND